MKNWFYLKISQKRLELSEFPVTGNWDIKGIFFKSQFQKRTANLSPHKFHSRVQPSMDDNTQEKKGHQN